MTNEIIVKLENVTFDWGGEPAIENINLEIKRGDFLGIIGPNGSGKTTLLKAMLNLLTPQKGRIELFGQDINSFRDWSKIGYVPQCAGLGVANFPISAAEVVGMGGASAKVIAQALKEVEMQEFSNHIINKLSGGQQQRVFIARALASQPELLILDEPTVGVDSQSQESFYKLLHKLNKDLNLTLVLVSHDIDVVAHEVNQIACINRKLICHGTPRTVLKSGFMEKLYGKDLHFVIHGH